MYTIFTHVIVSEVYLTNLRGSFHVPNWNEGFQASFFSRTQYSIYCPLLFQQTSAKRRTVRLKVCHRNVLEILRSVATKTTRRILAGLAPYEPEHEALQFDTKKRRLLQIFKVHSQRERAYYSYPEEHCFAIVVVMYKEISTCPNFNFV